MKMLTEFINSNHWAIVPERLDSLVRISSMSEDMNMNFTAEEIQSRLGIERNGERQSNGAVAVIPIIGPITNRENMFSDFFGSSTVEGIKKQLRSALNNDTVKTIIFDIDSPGGTVDGISELSKEIFNSRKSKKTISVANGLAASAAYWLASSASEVHVTESGDVGSIGVFTVHQSFAEALEKDGVDTTIISAGEFKTEGNPFKPLSKEARDAIQRDIDSFYKMFVDAVARNRGVTSATVADTFGKGRTVMAQPALGVGMVDGITTLDGILEKELSGEVKSKRSIFGSASGAITINLEAEKMKLELLAAS
jgi:capsid assembly protease